jgi:hypothetical protein
MAWKHQREAKHELGSVSPTPCSVCDSQRRVLLASCFAFNPLSEISFRFRRTLILTVLIALSDGVQNPLDGATIGSVLANFELAS